MITLSMTRVQSIIKSQTTILKIGIPKAYLYRIGIYPGKKVNNILLILP